MITFDNTSSCTGFILFCQTFSIQIEMQLHLLACFSDLINVSLAYFFFFKILAEFSRISGKNLQTEFFQELDRFTQRFIDIFKAKGGDIGCKLKKILQQIENEVSYIDIP